MAQVLKEEIREKILDSALNEFYEKGYKGATMQGIARKSGIPTGLIYSYYKNKEDLLTHVVSPVIMISDSLFSETLSHGESADNLFGNEIPKIIRMLSQYNRQFIILIDKSQGSSLVKIKDQIIEEVARHLKQIHFLKNTRFEEIVYHIFATNFMEGMFEIARHYVDEEWAVKVLDILVRQHLYGISSLEEQNNSEDL